MHTINFLPWREIQREHEKKNFLRVLLISIMFTLVLIALGYYYTRLGVESQLYRNQRLGNEIAILDENMKEIKKLKAVKNVLLARLVHLQRLHDETALTIHLLNDLDDIVPKGAYLLQLKRIKKTITAAGYAKSSHEIYQLMHNMSNKKGFNNPLLIRIKKTKTGLFPMEFALRFNLKGS